MVIAAVIWLLTGLSEPLPEVAAALLLGLAAVIALLRDWELLRFSMPQNARLVPQAILTHHPIRAGYQFGFEMGTGVRTFLTATLPYVAAAAIVLLAPSFGTAVVAGAGFGLGRSVMTWLRYFSADAEAWDARMKGRKEDVRRWAAVVGASPVLTLIWSFVA